LRAPPLLVFESIAFGPRRPAKSDSVLRLVLSLLRSPPVRPRRHAHAASSADSFSASAISPPPKTSRNCQTEKVLDITLSRRVGLSFWCRSRPDPQLPLCVKIWINPSDASGRAKIIPPQRLLGGSWWILDVVVPQQSTPVSIWGQAFSVPVTDIFYSNPLTDGTKNPAIDLYRAGFVGVLSVRYFHGAG
jgi:hypothetical protein